MNAGTRLFVYIRHYKFQSLFIKNLLLIVLLVVTPFAAMSVYVFSKMNHAVNNEIGAVSQGSLERIRDVVDAIFRQTDRTAAQFALQAESAVFLLSPDPGNILDNLFKNIYADITKYVHVYDYFDSLYLYSAQTDFVVSNRESGTLAELSDRNWIDAYKGSKNETPVIVARKHSDIYPNYISLVRPVFLGQYDKLGAVVVNIDIEGIGRAIGTSASGAAESVFMIDKKGIVIYSGNPDEFLRSAADVPMLAGVSFDQTGTTIVTLSGTRYVVSTVQSATQEWSYVSMLPLQHYSDRMSALERSSFLLFGAGLLVVLLVSLLITQRTFLPVKRILALIENPDSWMKRTGEPEVRETNELKFIVKNIVKTFDSNRQLQQELERRVAMLDKARSVALQSQINPHFLYNTLEAINWKAMQLTNGKNDVSDMVATLADLMALSKDANRHLVPLATEIEHARRYVDIMKLRFPDKFTVCWELDEGLRGCQVVQLALQPLIENAIEHGIRPARKNGMITVRCRAAGSDLIIEVTDDGVGITSEQAQQMNEKLSRDSGFASEHIGLGNVNQRIKLLFGDNYGVTLAPLPGGGTQVSLWMPRVEQ
ncbi:MAG: sensor histidine kinase [Paenibacillaceae bacterium]|nr:sensor histidine kinase [Paenibacillaceae bacterium]